MKSLCLKRLLLMALLLISFGACTSERGENSEGYGEPSVGAGNGFLSDNIGGGPQAPGVAVPSKTPGVTSDGSDQGREGGHFLICSSDVPISHSSCSENPREKCALNQGKIFFLDYFLSIDDLIEYDSLQRLDDSESAEQRLDAVVARLKLVFNGYPHLQIKLDRASQFSTSFMERKGLARWIQDDRHPEEIELTLDFGVGNMMQAKQEIINQYCDGRFYQAAVYDYSVFQDTVFEYSQYFEDHASELQKSFRNIHEMLRYVLKRSETKQIQALTAYLHTQAFFDKDLNSVRDDLKEISKQRAYQNPFFFGEFTDSQSAPSITGRRPPRRDSNSN